jgi:hypothetical protein
MGKNTHPNEIIITQENTDEMYELASSLGKGHVAALKEQVQRQSEK